MSRVGIKVKGHKRGANQNEMAVKGRKKDKNFSQSRDVREDRGTRQTKMGLRKNTVYR